MGHAHGRDGTGREGRRTFWGERQCLSLSKTWTQTIPTSAAEYIALRQAQSYLGQHARGGLHFGGEVKPQLLASRGGRDARQKTEDHLAKRANPPCFNNCCCTLASKAVPSESWRGVVSWGGLADSCCASCPDHHPQLWALGGTASLFSRAAQSHRLPQASCGTPLRRGIPPGTSTLPGRYLPQVHRTCAGRKGSARSS